MKQKLIVISADGLVGEDVEAMVSMPGFQKYFAHCAKAESMRSIYPTITYPCHTTMSTGVYPDKHKVLGNLVFEPGGQKLPWKWFYKYNQWKEDIFCAAHRAGLTTAAVFWPVTSCHPCIDYLIPEYWAQSDSQTLAEAFREGGSSPEVLEIIEKNLPIAHVPGGEIRTRHPENDEFILACTCDIIRRFAPDLLMIHPGNVDGLRHHHGVFGPEITKAVEDTDRYLAMVMDTLDETGLLSCTNVVLTSDHGLIDIERVVHLNQAFAQKGLLTIDISGKVMESGGKETFGKLASWEACVLSGGTSALVYLNPKAGDQAREKTERVLAELTEEGRWGIGSIFTQEEIREKEHLGGDFAFVVETDGHSAFGDRLLPPAVTYFEKEDYRSGKATHGHLPDKGPQPVFLGVGPGFRQDARIARAQLVDGAPTYARLLGVHLQGADGVPMEGLLKP